jgi:hypothetical protein
MASAQNHIGRLESSSIHLALVFMVLIIHLVVLFLCCVYGGASS